MRSLVSQKAIDIYAEKNLASASVRQTDLVTCPIKHNPITTHAQPTLNSTIETSLSFDLVLASTSAISTTTASHQQHQLTSHEDTNTEKITYVNCYLKNILYIFAHTAIITSPIAKDSLTLDQVTTTNKTRKRSRSSNAAMHSVNYDEDIDDAADNREIMLPSKVRRSIRKQNPNTYI
jgi:hypothetical protein